MIDFNKHNEFYLLIVGSRNYNNYEEFKFIIDKILENVIKKKAKITIVSGGANGTDAMAKVYANEKEYKYIEFPAEWDKYGLSAGYMRNDKMHKFISEKYNRGCIAFWDGKSKGTSHSFDLAKRYNNTIRIYNFIDKKFIKGE